MLRHWRRGNRFGLCCVSHAILTWRRCGVNGIPTYGQRGRKPNSRRWFLTVSALIRLLCVPGVTWASRRLYGTDYEGGLDRCIGPVDVSWRVDVHFWACHLSFPFDVDVGTSELLSIYSLGSSWRWQPETSQVEAFGPLRYVDLASNVPYSVEKFYRTFET